jgi:hypothetical protein
MNTNHLFSKTVKTENYSSPEFSGRSGEELHHLSVIAFTIA